MPKTYRCIAINHLSFDRLVKNKTSTFLRTCNKQHLQSTSQLYLEDRHNNLHVVNKAIHT